MGNENRSNQLALIKKDVVDVVEKKVNQFLERGELHLPPNYSPHNAMKSAWLILQNTVDKNKKPALQVCTRDSIANSLLDMVVQGLNPAKKQGYFIVFGNQLVFLRSYFGTMAVTKQVTNAKDIYAEVVYQGDEFEYKIERGRKYVTNHAQKLENVDKNNIVAAYCTIVFDDRPEYTEIMTMDQIKQAWKKSQMYRENGNGTHQQFTEEMAKKTVINRTCKAYINSSNDSSLVLDRFNRADEIAEEAKFEEEVQANANGEVIDVEGEVTDDNEPDKNEEEPELTKQPEYPKEQQRAKHNAPPQNMQQMSLDEAAASGPGF